MILYPVLIAYLLKFIVWFLRTFTGNSGTALPGLILENYFPKTAKKLLADFEKVILITGTNGKTTTAQMICHLLEQNGISYITNKSGSNLVRGVLSSVLDAISFVTQSPKCIGVFEVEEGSMPKLIKLVKADLIVVTNIFRDQLDAYGEIDKTWKYIKSAIQSSENPILVLNGDDSRVLSLGKYSDNKKFILHLDKKYLGQVKLEENGLHTDFELRDFESILINSVTINEDLSSSYQFLYASESISDNTKVPGLHNIMNAVYAQSVLKILNLGYKNLSIENFEPAFGRGEIISVQKIDGFSIQQFQILLAKNPAGLNLNFHLLENIKSQEAILLMLNDKTADGNDISWIWDADFEILRTIGFSKVFVSGSRRYDMALRCKYNGINIERIFENTNEACEFFTNSDMSKIFVLPTYTAMREFRDSMRKYTSVKEMWE